MFNQAAKIMEHVNIAMYIKNYGRICCIFCLFCIVCISCIFWYGGIFYILYILYCNVYKTMVKYCTFCVVRRSFQALFHITSSTHKHPFLSRCVHHHSSSVINIHHLLAITFHPSKPLCSEASGIV